MERLRHDAAWACAFSLLEVAGPYLPLEVRQRFLHEFYARLRAMLESYEILKNRERQRLAPSKN